MSLSYIIQPDRQLVVMTGDGKPDLQEFSDGLETIARDQFFQPGYSFLLDVRARSVAPDRGYVEQMVGVIGMALPRIGPGRWAFLCMSPAVYGMARMAEILAETHKVRIRVFRPDEYVDAMEWLSA